MVLGRGEGGGECWGGGGGGGYPLSMHAFT